MEALSFGSIVYCQAKPTKPEILVGTIGWNSFTTEMDHSRLILQWNTRKGWTIELRKPCLEEKVGTLKYL